MDKPLRIGILNLMSDKKNTKERFEKRLKQAGYNVDIEFFYPTEHYISRPLPDEVKELAKPLDLEKVAQMDGFIVTGAPIEDVEYDEVDYINELRGLFACLDKNDIEQLYVCWGAMAAANYFYGIDKMQLSEKYFGVFPNNAFADSDLMRGLALDFMAPHARYADVNVKQVDEHPDLDFTAKSKRGDAFLFEAKQKPQSFLLAHLEYGPDALQKEYERELGANPTADIPKPCFAHISWEDTSNTFFKNWLERVDQNRKEKLCTQ